MNYAIAVSIYIAVYITGFVLPLFFGSSASVIRLAMFSVPILLVAPRVAQRFTDGEPLLPQEVRNQGGLLYMGGIGLIWLGQLAFFGSLCAAIYLTVTSTLTGPIGLLAGYAMFPFLAGIVLVEAAYRQWSKRQSRKPWTSQRNSVYIIVGVIIAAQLVLNLSSDRPPDLLSYSEREALALGRGYAREVQRIVEDIYSEEEKMPCASDNFLDTDSLLHSANRDLSKMLSIELIECGQFVVTIHATVDGVPDGQLLHVAMPGDVAAGKPLDWQCFSADYTRIKRHTNNACTYDPSFVRAALDSVDATGSVRSSGRSSEQSREAVPSMQERLDRLAEPHLWVDCGEETTTYRLMRFDSGDYIAMVRISHNSQAGAYRSVTSSSPDKTIGLDGYVEDRTWRHVEQAVEAAGFWQLEPEGSTDGSNGTRMYLEACKNGRYHRVQRGSDDASFASVSRIFASVGRLEWLEN